MKKSFRMAPMVQDKGDIPVFSLAERMFLCNLRIAGESYSSICIKFAEKYSKCPPPPSNFNAGPHGLLFEPLDQNRTKVDQNMTRVQSKSVEFHNYY